jgi:hypothetical protein
MHENGALKSERCTQKLALALVARWWGLEAAFGSIP